MAKGRFRIRDDDDSVWRYLAAHRGDEWARLTLPSGTFTSETLSIPSGSNTTVQSAAPTGISVASGSGRNIRVALNWSPPEEMTGWLIVPYVGSTEYPGRIIYPLGLCHAFNRSAISFNNTSNPGTFRGCMIQWTLDETNEETRMDVLRYNSTIGLPSSARLRIYPWYGG